MRISDWSSDVCSSDLTEQTPASAVGSAFGSPVVHCPLTLPPSVVNEIAVPAGTGLLYRSAARMLSVVDAPSQLPLIASLVADSEKLFWSGRPVVTTSCSACDEIVCPLAGSVASAFPRTAVCTLPAWTTAQSSEERPVGKRCVGTC